MPPKSRSQARFMRGVASGSIKAKDLSRKQAAEYVKGTPTRNLPNRVKRKKK
jgi:hypothetical protein